jgi:hypothetical protein
MSHDASSDQEDRQLLAAQAALNLLTLTGDLAAQAARMVATGEGSMDELDAQADYAALCLTAAERTRLMASDLMMLAASEARRALGRDQDMTSEQFQHALRLVGYFELRVRNAVLG